jgi:RimJ/RimL family protein N-acetyltransferase
VLTRVGFELFGVDRIEIRVDPANATSERVPARLGFAKEATLRRRLPEKQGSELRDVNIWTLFRTELAGSPAGAYGYTAYDGLGRLIP